MEWLSLKIKRRGLLIDFWCSWLWSKNMSVMGALSNTWSVVLPALILSESEGRDPVQFVNGLHDVKFGPHWVKFQVRGRNSCSIVFRYDSSESAIFASWFADKQGEAFYVGQRVVLRMNRSVTNGRVGNGIVVTLVLSAVFCNVNAWIFEAWNVFRREKMPCCNDTFPVVRGLKRHFDVLKNVLKRVGFPCTSVEYARKNLCQYTTF